VRTSEEDSDASAASPQVECLYALEDYDGLAALVNDPEQQLAEGRSGPTRDPTHRPRRPSTVSAAIL